MITIPQIPSPQTPYYGGLAPLEFPQTQAATNNFIQHVQQRQQLAYQNYLSNNDALQKEFGNLRSPDIAPAIAAFQNYKDTRLQALSNPKVFNNPQSFNDANNQALQYYAQFMGKVNDSKQKRGILDAVNHDMVTHPHSYDDSSQKLWLQANAAPSDDPRWSDGTFSAEKFLAPINWDEPKVLSDAIGEVKGTRKGDIINDPTTGESKQEVYKLLNDPSQAEKNIYEKVIGTPKYADYAAHEMELISPQEIAQQKQLYDNTDPALFKKRWGFDKPDLTLQPEDYTNPAKIYSNFKALEYANHGTYNVLIPSYQPVATLSDKEKEQTQLGQIKSAQSEQRQKDIIDYKNAHPSQYIQFLMGNGNPANADLQLAAGATEAVKNNDQDGLDKVVDVLKAGTGQKRIVKIGVVNGGKQVAVVTKDADDVNDTTVGGDLTTLPNDNSLQASLLSLIQDNNGRNPKATNTFQSMQIGGNTQQTTGKKKIKNF